MDYWQGVPEADKTALVYTQASYNTEAQQVVWTAHPPTNEGDVKERQGPFVPVIHNYAGSEETMLPCPRMSIRQWLISTQVVIPT